MLVDTEPTLRKALAIGANEAIVYATLLMVLFQTSEVIKTEDTT
jgi:hypothetical protein